MIWKKLSWSYFKSSFRQSPTGHR